MTREERMADLKRRARAMATRWKEGETHLALPLLYLAAEYVRLEAQC